MQWSFPFFRSFLRPLLKRPSRVTLAYFLLLPGYLAANSQPLVQSRAQGHFGSLSAVRSPNSNMNAVICLFAITWGKYVMYGESLHIMSFTLYTYNVMYFIYNNSPYMTYVGCLVAIPLTRRQNDPGLEIAADQGGAENCNSSNSPCCSLVVVICISVWETAFYGIMQAGQKLGIVYIGKAGGKVCAETFRLVSFTYLYLIGSRTKS